MILQSKEQLGNIVAARKLVLSVTNKQLANLCKYKEQNSKCQQQIIHEI